MMLRKLFIGLLVVVPVLRWSVGCSNSHPDTIAQYPGARSPEADSKPAKPLSPQQSAKLCVQTARQLEAAGYLADAASQYERARRFNPTDFSIGHRLATLYDRMGDAQAAALEYELAMRNTPNNADLINDYGYFHYNKGRYDRAEQLFRKSLACDASHQRATTNLAMTLAQENRYEESIRYFEKVVSPASARSNVAMIQAQQGKFELARASADKALKINPDLVQAHAVKRFIDEQQNRVAAAPARPSAPYALEKPAAKVEETPARTAEAPARPAARVASAKPEKFVPVAADPVIAPKREPQAMASPAQTTQILAQPETAAAPVTVAAVPAPVSAAVTPAPARVIESAAPRVEASPIAPVIDAVAPSAQAPIGSAKSVAALPASASATPAPAEMPAVVAQLPQRKMIAPVGVRPAREEELVEMSVSSPAPVGVSSIVSDAPVAQLALAELKDVSKAEPVMIESRRESLDVVTLVDPAVSASIRRMTTEPAIVAEGARLSAIPQPVEITPVIEQAETSAPRAVAMPAARAAEPAIVAVPQTVAAAPVAPIIESVAPSAPVAKAVSPAQPVAEPVHVEAAPIRQELAANIVVAPAEPTQPRAVAPAPSPTRAVTPAVVEPAPMPAAPMSDAMVIVPALPAGPRDAKAIELAAAVPAHTPAPASEAAPAKPAPAAKVTRDQLWIENPGTSRFNKGRAPTFTRKDL